MEEAKMKVRLREDKAELTSRVYLNKYDSNKHNKERIADGDS
jgi:hypothetical protein